MLNSLNMVNNYTGIDFENGCVELLEHCGFKASKTSEEDRGVDIIASITTNENAKKYYIQCKYQNKTLSMHPVQEVFAGTHYHGGDGIPVLITNNHVSYGARQYADTLGVEVIGAPEWMELKEAYKNKRIVNLDRQGLAGILIGALSGNQEFVAHNLQTSIVKVDSREAIKSIVIDEFDKLLKYRKKADQLRQQASILEQKAIIMQREEMLKHLGFL